jgi:Flp pilus assembly protein CpaB
MKTIGLLAALTAALALSAWAADTAPKNKVPFPEGYRAVTIPLPSARLAFVKKGDRVDVIVDFDAQMKDAKEKVGATILQNVLVADVRASDKLEALGAVELIVNPNEAQYAALSLAQAEIHLSIRPPGDTKMAPMEMASFRKLFQ